MTIYITFIPVLLLFISILLLPIYTAKDISNRRRQIFSLAAILFFCGGSFFLYQQFGTSEILPLLAEREVRLSALKEKIIATSTEVKKNPKNLASWIELGDSFMESSQFSAAANAYKQAIMLSEGKPEIIMAYIHALIIGADGIVTNEAKKSLDMMFILQPRNEEVRYFLAMHKMQSGDTKAAMLEMKALYKSLANDSPIKDMIDRQINRK